MEERYLSLSEATRALGISERTAYRWINAGKLRAYKPGRDYRIPESAVREAVEGSRVRPKAPAPRSSNQPPLNGFEEERRLPSLRSWITLAGVLADRWAAEFEEREAEWQAANPHTRKAVKLLPNLSWANEIHGTYGDVLQAAVDELEHGLDVYESAEVRELFQNAQRLQEILERTWPWFPGERAPRLAEVIDLQRAMGERVAQITARGSQETA